MTRGRTRFLAAALVLLVGPLSGRAAAQEVRAPANDVPVEIRQAPPGPVYAPLPWEVLGFRPLLAEAVSDVAREDAAAARFASPGELGGFRSAPVGGSALMGPGVPLFGLAAPDAERGGQLPPGNGLFLTRSVLEDDTTVIPQVGLDEGRGSYTFTEGIPPLVDEPGSVITFPPPGAVEAGPRDLTPDDDDEDDEDDDPLAPVDPTRPRTTTPTPSARVTTPSTRVTTPSIGVTAPVGTPPTSAPAPPAGTTTIAPPPRTTPTTGTPPTTSTTVWTTTTTTVRPTTTTTIATTTTTIPPIEVPPVSFVLSNERASGTACLSNAGGSTSAGCGTLFDLSSAVPGQPYVVPLTLWNVGNARATRLEAFSPSCSSSGPGPGTGDLCAAIELKIERFDEVARAGTAACVFGCGARRTLTHFVADHGAAGAGALLDDRFEVNEKAYLTLTITLPNRGFTADGTGRDNEYLGRRADISFTWRMAA